MNAKELLVGFHKRGSGKPSITWPESVDEALCFGWIDGVTKRIDDDAYTVRFTPRRPTSIWSAINVAKVAALEKLGRMTPAGRRAFAARSPERTGVYSFERQTPAELNPDEQQKLRANARATEFFDAQPAGYRRSSLHWVVSAKREATRRRRLDQLIAESERGRTLAHLTGREPASARAKTKLATRATKAKPPRDEKTPAPEAERRKRPAAARNAARGANGTSATPRARGNPVAVAPKPRGTSRTAPGLSKKKRRQARAQR